MNRKKIKKIITDKIFHRILFFIIFVSVSVAGFLFINFDSSQREVSSLQILSMNLGEENESLKKDLADNVAQLDELRNQDQYKTNIALQENIRNIENTYSKSVSVYEDLLELKESSKDDLSELDEKYTSALVLLSQQKYKEANDALNSLSGDISSKQQAIAASFTIPASTTVSNDPPSSGYSRQQVKSDIGNYLVSIVAADLSSTKVIVDTASSSDCANECPVLSLSEYVSRNSAYAGINGSYFCPASYPSCAGKTNSFDTLLMNKNKTYFNSDNNVYSNIPAVIFGGSYIRFVGQSSEWGRDTGIDSMIANQNMLVQGGNNAFVADGDPKKGVKSGRSFVGNKGNTVFIGVVHNATLAEAAIVLHTIGLDNALSLDSGGSTALWSGGYKVGPGRNIPNAILFMSK